jgi:UDP-2,4-diacetamido-2,4,6-trideoxy-beta-L-altropyranose hydrolase
MRSGRAVFRADAAQALGAGHIYRCLALANGLAEAGWTCTFAVGPETRTAAPVLFQSGHQVIPAEALEGSADLLVVDHYGLDHEFENRCRRWAKRILAIDDLADRRHDCDLLVDQTLGRATADYDGLVSAGCVALLGPRYALLRPTFGEARAHALSRRDGGMRRILISVGGTDPRDMTSRALRAIVGCGFAGNIDVVLGGSSPNRETVAALVSACEGRARLHLDTPHMAALMTEADLAIGACGTSSWERCVLGLPTVGLVTADNQEMISAELSAVGAVMSVGGWNEAFEARIGAAVEHLSNSPEDLRRMSEAAAAVCDGGGVARVIAAVSCL